MQEPIIEEPIIGQQIIGQQVTRIRTMLCEYCKSRQHALHLCKHPSLKLYCCEQRKRLIRASTESEESMMQWLNTEPMVALKVLCKQQHISIRGNTRARFIEKLVSVYKTHNTLEVQVDTTVSESLEGFVQNEVQNEVQNNPSNEINDFYNLSYNEIENTLQNEVQNEVENEVQNEVQNNPSNEVQNEAQDMTTRRSRRIQRRITRYEPPTYHVAHAENDWIKYRNTPVQKIKCSYEKPRKTDSLFYKDDCPICFEPQAYIITQCNHTFCSCIMQEIMKPGSQSRCPYCRTTITSLRFKHIAYYNVLKSVSAGLTNTFKFT